MEIKQVEPLEEPLLWLGEATSCAPSLAGGAFKISNSQKSVAVSDPQPGVQHLFKLYFVVL